MKIYKQHPTKLSNYTSILMSVLAINGKVYSSDQDYIPDSRNKDKNSYNLRTANTNSGEPHPTSRKHQRDQSSASTYSTSTDEAPTLIPVPKSGENVFLPWRTGIFNPLFFLGRVKVFNDPNSLSRTWAASEKGEESETNISVRRNSWSSSLNTKEIVHNTEKNDSTTPHSKLSNDVPPQTSFSPQHPVFIKDPNEIWNYDDLALHSLRSQSKERDKHQSHNKSTSSSY